MNLDQHMIQAVQSHQSGQFARAIAFYKEALTRIPNQSDILNLLGTAYSQLHQYDLGLNYIQQALDIQTNHPNYLINLEETLIRCHRSREAKNCFEQVIQLYPQHDIAHYNLAQLLKKEAQRERSIIHYRQATELYRGS